MKGSELAVMSAPLAFPPGCITSATGLTLPDSLQFEDWERVGLLLDYIGQAHQWWRGDWLRFGERKYGEMYAQALGDPSGPAYQTLANEVYVASRVEFSRRRENLKWSHHAEVAPLSPDEQDEWLDRAEAEHMTQKELRTAIGYSKRLAATAAALPTGQYVTLVADPPWQYENVATRGAATNHYPTLSLDQLTGRVSLPDGQNLVADIVRPRLADDAHLYLWATSPLLPCGFDVLDAWGFTYKTSLVWVKPQPGIGNYFRSQHELVLFGVRGHLPVLDKTQPSWFEAKRTKHSQKPERLYEMVERASPGPYLELFARPLPLLGARQGWATWGNEG